MNETMCALPVKRLITSPTQQHDDKQQQNQEEKREHRRKPAHQQVTSCHRHDRTDTSDTTNDRNSAKSDLGSGLSGNTVEEEAVDDQSSQFEDDRDAGFGKNHQQHQTQKKKNNNKIMSAEQQLHRHPPLEPLLKYTFPALNEALVNVPVALFGGRALMMMACNPQVRTLALQQLV